MIPSWLNALLPEQRTGKQSTITTGRRLRSEVAAHALFNTAKDRLLDVNRWHKFAGRGRAAFQLTGADGTAVYRPAQKGDFFQINIPGPGSKAGGGNDWVRIEEAGQRDEQDLNFQFFTVRASAPPWKPKQDTAHFFDQSATSTFVVMRMGRTVSAGVYGRNEQPNRNKGHWLDRIRNLLVAVGAMLGLSFVQWKSLTKGLVRR